MIFCVMMALHHYHYSELPCLYMHKHSVEMKHRRGRKVNYINFFNPPTAGEISQIKYPNTVSSQFIFNLQTINEPRKPALSPTLNPNPFLILHTTPKHGTSC